MTRLIDADKLYPDCITKKGTVAISQSQIANAPTVDVYTEEQVKELVDLNKKLSEERPKGEWIKGQEISRTIIGDKEYIDYKDYTCSNCGLVLDRLLYWTDGSPFYKFCPECGADMRGDSSDNKRKTQ